MIESIWSERINTIIRGLKSRDRDIVSIYYIYKQHVKTSQVHLDWGLQCPGSRLAHIQPDGQTRVHVSDHQDKLGCYFHIWTKSGQNLDKVTSVGRQPEVTAIMLFGEGSTNTVSVRESDTCGGRGGQGRGGQSRAGQGEHHSPELTGISLHSAERPLRRWMYKLPLIQWKQQTGKIWLFQMSLKVVSIIDRLVTLTTNSFITKRINLCETMFVYWRVLFHFWFGVYQSRFPIKQVFWWCVDKVGSVIRKPWQRSCL